jgi:hypothetical protein
MSQAQSLGFSDQAPNHTPNHLPDSSPEPAAEPPSGAQAEVMALAEAAQASVAEMPPARTMGSPLQMGTSGRQSPSAPNGANGAGNRPAAPPPGRTLSAPATGGSEQPSSLQRAIGVARSIFPLVQRLLPLLDGNFATALGNLVSGATQPKVPAPKLDLAPIEDRVSELRIQHRGLRDQIMEQNAAIMEQSSMLKRVEDQLEMVREATDRNTLEQQEMLEDLKAFGSKLKIIAFVTLGLVGLGLIVNVIIFLRFKSVFP